MAAIAALAALLDGGGTAAIHADALVDLSPTITGLPPASPTPQEPRAALASGVTDRQAQESGDATAGTALEVATSQPVRPDEGSGIRSVLEAVHDDPALSELLRLASALRLWEPKAGAREEDDATGAPDADAPLSAQQPGSAGQAPSDGARPTAARSEAAALAMPANATGGEPDAPPTLRDQLHAVVHHDPARDQAKAIRTITDQAADDFDFDLGERLLDSRLLGEAFAVVIQRNRAYLFDTSFSVFGRGQFQLNVANDMSSINLYEYSTGTDFAMTSDRPVEDPAQPPPPQAGPSDNPDLITLVKRFLATSEGALMTITAALFVLIYGMIRFAALLRR